MKNFESRSRIPRALVRLGLESPRRVLIFWAVIASISSFGVAKLRVETSTASVLDRSDPRWSFYQESQLRFGGDEVLTILIEGDVPFDPVALHHVVRITARLQAVSGVARVDSLATVPSILFEPSGDFSLEPALAGGVPERAEDLAALAERVRRDRIAPRMLVSSDEHAFAINLVLERGAEPQYESILTEIEDATKGTRTWVSGVPIFRVAADARTRAELKLFGPVTIAVISVTLFVLFGTFRAVLIPICTSGLGIWIMLGVMGALGVPITITTVVLPSILLALGCAYSLHFLCGVAATGKSNQTEALLIVSFPVALSGLTTSLGFLAMSFVKINAIRDIGIFGALGVLLVLIATLTVSPAALVLSRLLPRRPQFQKLISEQYVPIVLKFVQKNRRGVLVAWLAMMATVSIGFRGLAIETDVILWFPPDDPIRVAYRNIRDRLSGISPQNIVIEAPESGTVAIEVVLSTIDRLAMHLESLPAVGRVISIGDPLRQLHGGFIRDPAMPMPNDEALISQYLALLESTPYLRNLLSADWRVTNLVMRIDDNRSGSLRSVARDAERWWNDNGVEGYTARATGIMYEFARAEDAIAYGQLQGLALAFSAVTVLLLAIFRSIRISWYALVPNLIPLAIGFGMMGLLGVPLDAGTIIIANLAFGIAVDDSIHAVAHFHARFNDGASVSETLHATYRRVSPPLVYTSIVVAFGFIVLAFSDFAVIRHLGALTAALMILCLLADLFLLPALLLGLRDSPRGVGLESNNQ